MPNGYGMVKVPHFCGQPGLVIFGAVSMLVGVVANSAVILERESERRSHGIPLKISMFVTQKFQNLG